MPTPTPPSGPQIREARLAQGWRQTDLAIHIADNGYGRVVDQGSISRIENGGDIPPRMIGPLLRALPDLADSGNASLAGAA